MATVSDLIKDLQKLEAQGFGDAQVFYRHGASGDCGELSSPSISTRVDECGPFDLDEGETYVQIYAGNITTWKMPLFKQGDMVSIPDKKLIVTVISVSHEQDCAGHDICTCSVSYIGKDKHGNEHHFVHNTNVNLIHQDFVHLYQ